MTLQELIEFGNDYASLGDALMEQVVDLIHGKMSYFMNEEPRDVITDGALELIKSRLIGHHPDLDQIIEACCQSRKL